LFDEAQRWYERALTVSVQLESQPLVMYQSINAGNALVMQRKFDEALNYYKAAEQLAEINNALTYRVQALELMGHTHRHAGQLDEAERVWCKAVDLSRQSKFDAGQRVNLENLLRLYDERGDSARLHECQRELALLVTAGAAANA
jgi:tetratricopeptide (TPR) repeat protein